MTKKSKIIVTIALMLGISLASLDTTIVGTAMPTIVGKLGGITLYSWVFSAYLLNQLQLALAQSLFWIYALMFVCALIGLAFMFLLPGGNAEQYSYKDDKQERAQLVATKLEPEIKLNGPESPAALAQG